MFVLITLFISHYFVDNVDKSVDNFLTRDLYLLSKNARHMDKKIKLCYIYNELFSS